MKASEIKNKEQYWEERDRINLAMEHAYDRLDRCREEIEILEVIIESLRIKHSALLSYSYLWAKEDQ